MTRYLIENPISGTVFGVYEGNTAADALDAMARDAGYADHAEACSVAGTDDLTTSEWHSDMDTAP